MRNDVLAGLERRETTLLRLLDKQVEVREFILMEEGKELAAIRARALAAKEESKLAILNITYSTCTLCTSNKIDGAQSNLCFAS